MLPALNLGDPCVSPSSKELGLLWVGWHIKPMSVLPAESVTALTVYSAEPADDALQEEHTMSCQRNGDTVCTISFGIWIQVLFFFIQSQTEAWADSTYVFHANYQGKWWDSGLLEAKPNSHFSMTLKASRNLSWHFQSRLKPQPSVQTKSTDYCCLHTSCLPDSILSDLLIFSDCMIVCNISSDKSMPL